MTASRVEPQEPTDERLREAATRLVMRADPAGVPEPGPFTFVQAQVKAAMGVPEPTEYPATLSMLVSAAESMIGFAEGTITSTGARQRFDEHYVPRLRGAIDAVFRLDLAAVPAAQDKARRPQAGSRGGLEAQATR